MHYLNNNTDVKVKTDSFLKTLRESSAQNHSLLESNSLLSSLLSPEITTHQYYCYLFLMQRVHYAYEKIILNHLSFLQPDWCNRRSTEIISEDLKTIGDVPSTLMLKDYRLSLDMSLNGNVAGFSYVMEGSRLGGKVIYKNIKHTLGFSDNKGAKFISDYGFETGPNWKNFLSTFSRYVVENDIEADTIAGANKAFASIYEFFESNKLVYEI